MIPARPAKKNGAQGHADLARAWGDYLLADSLTRTVPLASPLGLPLPALADASGPLGKPVALLVRTLVLAVPRTANDTRRRALGGVLLALADLLEALQLPETSPYWLKDD